MFKAKVISKRTKAQTTYSNVKKVTCSWSLHYKEYQWTIQTESETYRFPEKDYKIEVVI